MLLVGEGEWNCSKWYYWVEVKLSGLHSRCDTERGTGRVLQDSISSRSEHEGVVCHEQSNQINYGFIPILVPSKTAARLFFFFSNLSLS